MQAFISAIGTATPDNKLSQQETAEFIINLLNLTAVEKRLLKSVYKASGIEHRHSVLNYKIDHNDQSFFPSQNESFPTTSKRMAIYKQHALNLGIAAVNDCCKNLDSFNLHDITHVITVSCTGMYAPGIDIELVHRLSLLPSTKRTAINFMGCYGAFNAIKIAESICKAEPDATVLIVSVEICSIHFQKEMHLDNIIANSIFSDGAAAIIIQSQCKQKKFLSLESFHCDLIPQENQAMAWHIADTGFDIVLSSYVPEIIKSGIADFTNKLLQDQALSINDIDLYAIHPGGVKILQACEEALNINKEQNKYSYNVLRKYGNMSSATILFVLKEILDQLTDEDDQKSIFSCAFGPGLTLESMLLKTNCRIEH